VEDEMPNGISRETYEQMAVNDKLNVLYDLHQDTYKLAYEAKEKIIILEQKVDRRRKIDSTVAAGMGLVGGAAVWIVKWVGGK